MLAQAMWWQYSGGWARGGKAQAAGRCGSGGGARGTVLSRRGKHGLAAELRRCSGGGAREQSYGLWRRGKQGMAAGKG
jgi:hypothetical protein